MQKVYSFLILLLIASFCVACNSKEQEIAIGLNKFGLDYLNNKKYEKAINEFNKSIDAYPQYAEAYSNRSIAYSKLGETERAQKMGSESSFRYY